MIETEFYIDEKQKSKEYREKGWKILGHFCSYTPEELFYPFKILPVRLFPEFSGSYELADRYFPAYTCSFGRSSLNSLLSGKLDDYDGFFFSSTCDTIRHLVYHFRRFNDNMYVPHITIPAKAHSDSAEELLFRELVRLEQELRSYHGEPGGTSLETAVELYRMNRALMREIVLLKINKPWAIPSSLMNDIHRFNIWNDKRTVNPKLIQFIKSVRDSNGHGEHKPRIFVLGNCCGNNSILEFIEDCGCYVVNDLLGSGNKYYQDVKDNTTPLAYMASRMSRRIVCPTKIFTYSEERKKMLNRIRDIIVTSGIDGIILLGQKFCDPHGLDKPMVMQMLKEMEAAVLELESEQDINNPEQIRNRIDAFVEMIA